MLSLFPATCVRTVSDINNNTSRGIIYHLRYYLNADFSEYIPPPFYVQHINEFIRVYMLFENHIHFKQAFYLLRCPYLPCMYTVLTLCSKQHTTQISCQLLTGCVGSYLHFVTISSCFCCKR